jgi:hypothetical protein
MFNENCALGPDPGFMHVQRCIPVLALWVAGGKSKYCEHLTDWYRATGVSRRYPAGSPISSRIRSGLRRCPTDFTVDLWLLTHEDLRQTARSRAFLDFLAKALARAAPLLEGLGRQEVDPISDALAQGAERAPSIRR